jgi:uncharacterized delta-60 repeat protein
MQTTTSLTSGCIFRALVRLIAVLCVCVTAQQAVSATLDDHFHSPVLTYQQAASRVLVLPDDSFLVYQSGTRLNNNLVGGVIKFKADGTIDPSFRFSTDYSSVGAVVQLPDTSFIVAAGHDSKTGGFYDRILHIGSNGTIDASFDAGLGADSTVYALVVQKDGKILVAGDFSHFNGVARPYLVRLNPNGSLDTSFAKLSLTGNVNAFDPMPRIYAALLQADGKLVIAGSFTTADATATTGVARLNENGSVDTSFVSTISDTDMFPMHALALAADQTILVAGENYNQCPEQLVLFRLKADGEVAQAFAAPTCADFASTYAVKIAPNGNIIASGNTLYEFKPDGTAVAGFHQALFQYNNSGEGEPAVSLALQSNGDILAAGARFADKQYRGGLARVHPDGSLDSFKAGEFQTEVVPDKIAARSDGKIYLATRFEKVNGTPRDAIARLNKDGTLDTTFDPLKYGLSGLSGFVLQPDDKIVISTTNSNGGYSAKRIDADDRLDPSFADPGVDLGNALLRPDGSYLAKSPSDQYTLMTSDPKLPPVVHVLADGTVDQDFHFDITASTVMRAESNGINRIQEIYSGDNRAIAALPNNRALFRYYDKTGNYHLVELQADGSVDASFKSGVVSGLASVDLEHIYDPNDFQDADGYAALIADASRAAISDALVLSDGKVIVVGEFSQYSGTPANGIVRLLGDGSVDKSFKAGKGAEWVTTKSDASHLPRIDSIKLQHDGKLLIAGTFEAYDGSPAPGIARLNPDGSLDRSFVAPVELIEKQLTATSNLAPLKDGTFLLSGPYASAGAAAIQSVSHINTLTEARLANISTRMRVQTGDNALIGGFIVSGPTSKNILIRAIGPSLPIADHLADPVLELHKAGGTVLTNDNWQDTQRAEIVATTIPPSNSLESAIVATLPPGNHTAIVRGKNGAAGVALVEIYDLDNSVPTLLANISTRGDVLTGNDVMIGGVIVTGAQPANVFLRALGPSLPVSGALQDPVLELHDANGNVTIDDNWKDTQEAAINATSIPPPDDRESAIIQTLPPGNYTAVLHGKDNATGVALVEAYRLN